MKRLLRISLTVISAFLAMAAVPVMADSLSDTIEVFKKSPAVRPFFDTAYGYAVFPVVGKGGLFIGGAYGKGKLYRAGRATGTVTLSKMTLGLQFGGQAFSEIVFLEDDRAYNEFTSGSFEFDANLSAVAITAGAQARIGSMGPTAGASAGPATGIQAGHSYRKGMAAFVHAKWGLMLEAAVGGQRFVFQPYKTSY